MLKIRLLKDLKCCVFLVTKHFLNHLNYYRKITVCGDASLKEIVETCSPSVEVTTEINNVNESLESSIMKESSTAAEDNTSFS